MNLSMALTLIDLTDDGWWKSGAVHPYASRKAVAQGLTFSVLSTTDGSYWVKRDGGSWHHVHACVDGTDIKADCDCYDFQHYGAGFNRACMHIWYILLNESGGPC